MARLTAAMRNRDRQALQRTLQQPTPARRLSPGVPYGFITVWRAGSSGENRPSPECLDGDRQHNSKRAIAPKGDASKHALTGLQGARFG